MNMKYSQIQQTNQVNVTQYLYSYDFHSLLTKPITQSSITYLKWFVSKKNANKVVKIFTSCRFIPPAFCDDLENIPEMIPERCREKVSWCCLDSQIQRYFNFLDNQEEKVWITTNWGEKRSASPWNHGQVKPRLISSSQHKKDKASDPVVPPPRFW